jgi:programmed cell death 8 (apoptosis-inducing factor)
MQKNYFIFLLYFSIFYEPKEFYTNVDQLISSDKGGVAVAMGWKVKKIDIINKTVILEDGYEVKYNKCLIATGECHQE